MKIVVAARCYNEIKNVERFVRCYNFADVLVVSDGGSTDGSIEFLEKQEKVRLFHFGEFEIVNGYRWNPDAPHMNFVLDRALTYDPDFLIFDDMDDVPNRLLQDNARNLIENCEQDQIHGFRLYMWGDDQYFPTMNNYFDPLYRSLWGWFPSRVNIWADPLVRHGTLVGINADSSMGLELPMCLLHRSWNPETIQADVDRYNAIGLPMEHPLEFAGIPEKLPDFAHE